MPILSNFPGGAGSGSGGLTLAAVSGITTQVSSGKVYVKWTDPDDLVVAGSTIAAWGGTLLVRKAGSAPTSRRDGTIVLDSKTRDAYKNTYFCDSGLSNGTKYYYKFFPYTTANAYAHKVGIRVTLPKWGLSRGEYFFDRERKIIAKGLTSIKYIPPSRLRRRTSARIFCRCWAMN